MSLTIPFFAYRFGAVVFWNPSLGVKLAKQSHGLESKRQVSGRNAMSIWQLVMEWVLLSHAG